MRQMCFSSMLPASFHYSETRWTLTRVMGALLVDLVRAGLVFETTYMSCIPIPFLGIFLFSLLFFLNFRSFPWEILIFSKDPLSTLEYNSGLKRDLRTAVFWRIQYIDDLMNRIGLNASPHQKSPMKQDLLAEAQQHFNANSIWTAAGFNSCCWD